MSWKNFKLSIFVQIIIVIILFYSHPFELYNNGYLLAVKTDDFFLVQDQIIL
jgi:hypothetical protein